MLKITNVAHHKGIAGYREYWGDFSGAGQRPGTGGWRAVIEGAFHRLRPKLMTVAAVLASLIPILSESGVGSDVMKPIAAPIVGGMITSTIHVLILVPVFFVLLKGRALRHGKLRSSQELQEE